MKRALAVPALVLLVAATALGQAGSNPRLGVWKLNLQKSKFDPAIGPAPRRGRILVSCPPPHGEQSGWISAEWHVTANRRRARVYRMTRIGQKRLEEEQDKWHRLTKAVGKVLRFA
jgi:hypothetical protein